MAIICKAARELEMRLKANEREPAGGHAQVVDHHATDEEQRGPSQRMRKETSAILPASPRDSFERVSDTPTMKRKQGNIVSAKVQPFHAACANWE